MVDNTLRRRCPRSDASLNCCDVIAGSEWSAAACRFWREIFGTKKPWSPGLSYGVVCVIHSLAVHVCGLKSYYMNCAPLRF